MKRRLVSRTLLLRTRFLVTLLPPGWLAVCAVSKHNPAQDAL
jgi:hypothetical protein